jgi:uncharacterized protein (DUF1800 family)
MALTNRTRNQHLLWRAAFGPMAENAASLDSVSTKELWELLLQTSSREPEKIAVADNMVDGLVKGVKDIVDTEKATQMSEEDKKEQKKKIRQQSREDLKNLNLRWLDEMINSEAQLREKMSLFWHGHFACRVINSYFQQELLHVIRANALGNFGTLLKEVSRSPAMLQFLNNQQNRKKKPNENFAREVMELFTLGRGNYTESDIKEAARSFTGWGFNLKGEFEFRKFQHDDETKTVFGKTGNFDGDDILNMLLEKKQTARFISTKLYRYFVNEEPDEQKVNWLADRFYNNQYDIKKLLTDIFQSEWFYEEKNIGNKIKSPVELIAGMRRLLPLELSNESVQLLFQKLLGQVLFFPPNVAGWPGGRNWIDSSTLMVRLQIPRLLTASENIQLRAKGDDDVDMGKMKDDKNTGLPSKRSTASINWPMLTTVFEKIPRDKLAQQIADILLQSRSRTDLALLEKHIRKESREAYIKTAVINLMSTPEYQLC